MPRIIVQAVSPEGEPRRWTLAERIVPTNSGSGYYMSQLIDRLAWATADAEALESRVDGAAAPSIGERRPQSHTRRRGDRPPAEARRTRTG